MPLRLARDNHAAVWGVGTAAAVQPPQGRLSQALIKLARQPDRNADSRFQRREAANRNTRRPNRDPRRSRSSGSDRRRAQLRYETIGSWPVPPTTPNMIATPRSGCALGQAMQALQRPDVGRSRRRPGISAHQRLARHPVGTSPRPAVFGPRDYPDQDGPGQFSIGIFRALSAEDAVERGCVIFLQRDVGGFTGRRHLVLATYQLGTRLAARFSCSDLRVTETFCA